MKKIILVLILSLSVTILIAKNNKESELRRPLNSTYINLLGDASLISVNYERLYFLSSNFMLTGKLGLGYNEESSFGGDVVERFITIPHHITGNFGKGRHFFEFGVGGTVMNDGKEENFYGTDVNYLLYPIVGYRISPLNSGKVNFRIFGHIPTQTTNKFNNFIPFGFSLGASF